MFSLSLFISYISTLLILNGYYLILVIILPVAVYLIVIEYIQFSSYHRLLSFYLFFGLMLGTTYAFYTYNKYTDHGHTENETFRQARIIGATASSITVESNDKNNRLERFKIIHPEYMIDRHKINLYLFDQIDFSCNRWKNTKGKDTYGKLEGLQAVHNVCINSTILSYKPFLADFNSIRNQIQIKADYKLNLLGDKSYARGFLLSDTKNINKVELNIFRKMGIAHLFSASGLHMGLLYTTCFLPLSLLGLKKMGNFCGLIMCFFYLCLLDFQIPLLRSFFFISTYFFLQILKSKSNGRYILYFTIIFLELIFPFSSFLPSFILSFLITLTILLFYPQLEKIISIKNKFLRENLSLTLAASIGSSFLSLYFFHYFHPISIFYNFMLVPFSGPYLASVFLYFLVPYFRYVIFAGDYFYKQSAWVHYLMFEKNIPMIHFQFTQIWLLFFLFLIMYLIYHTIKKQYWFLRKYYLKSYILLCIFFFTNYLLIKIPVSGVVAFPNGVMEYKNGNYYIGGSLPDFYAENFKYLLQNNNLPFKNIYAPDSFSPSLHENIIHPDIQIKDDYNTSVRNMVSLNTDCFLFIYKNQPQKSHSRNILSCRNIYLVHSKKITPDLQLWKNFFLSFSYHGNVQLMTYLNWNWEYTNEKNH